MRRDKPKNLPASVRQRLLNLARSQKEDFQFVLTRYALERLLYRLCQSNYRDEFVLKGAMLFQLWGGGLHRPTRDLDLLGRGEISIARFEKIFREICAHEVTEDGLKFRAETVHGERIKEDQEYEGLRLHLECRLENVRIPIQVDIGFGDAITPEAIKTDYPVMLEFPAPSLLAYPRETVVAEKFQAMVMLGIANSRMKDFYDLWVLSREFEFQGAVLCKAIAVTFARRRTQLPSGMPVSLSQGFFDDRNKVTQWQAFIRKSKLDVQGAGLDQVALTLRELLMPPTEALVSAKPFEKFWPARGPWQ